jgi:hypothetical protein
MSNCCEGNSLYGESPNEGGGGGVDGQPIAPSSITTPLINATVENVITSNITTANITTANITTANITTEAVDILRFRVAEQRDPVSSAVINYRMPLVQPPQDGLTYSLCNNSTPTSVYNVPATGAAFSILLETASFAQTIRVVFVANTQITSEFLFDRINQSIASWFSQQGSQQSIFFTLDTSFFPYRTRLQILFAANRSQINVDANNQMAITLGWPNTTGTQTGPLNLASPNAASITARVDNSTLIWRNTDAIVPNQNNIQAVDGVSSVICNEIGTNLVSIIGGVDLNEASIIRITSVNSDGIAFTGNCGQSQLQIAETADGLSQSTTTYLRATDGISNAGVGCSIDSSFLIRNNLPRVIVDSETSLTNNLNRQCIRVYDYGTQIFGEGQPLAAGIRSSINLDGDIFFNREDPIYGLQQIFYSSGTGTTIWSPSTSTETSIDNNFFRVKCNNVEKLLIDNTGTKISNSYYLPTNIGSIGQVLMVDGATTTSFQTPQIIGLYSQTTPQTVANTNVQTSLIGAGEGSLSVPANYFTTGMSFEYKCGGLFRDNANGTTFRFRLTNSGVLFDSGILTLTNINTPTPWNIDVIFTYVGGTTLITNFNFQYNNSSDARGFTSQNTNNTFNTAIPNTLDFTVQWTVANANNTITSNFGVLSKLF